MVKEGVWKIETFESSQKNELDVLSMKFVVRR
jgi:hypothetical protein